MKIERLTYRFLKRLSPVSLILLLAVLLLAACGDDSIEEKEVPVPIYTHKQTVTFWAGAPTFLKVNQTTTRGLPSGYVPYYQLFVTTPPDNASISIIVATENDYDRINYYAKLKREEDGTFGRKWEAVLDVTDGVQYYIYGFMPREEAGNATIAPLTTGASYSAGCKFTINNLNTLTSKDVCTLVSVGKSAEPQNIEDMDIKLGTFDYRDPTDYPYIFLLLKHLYAGLHFKAHIDTEYNKVRTIKVTKMTLSTVDKISQKINLTFDVTANSDGDDPISNLNYEGFGTTDIATVQLFPPVVPAGSETVVPTEFELPTETTEEFLSCFAPGKCSSFILTTIYDVYDKKGNLIRKDCMAENKIDANANLNVNSLKAGDIYTIDLKVQPTYLYVLSDPDLDNPTFTVITGS